MELPEVEQYQQDLRKLRSRVLVLMICVRIDSYCVGWTIEANRKSKNPKWTFAASSEVTGIAESRKEGNTQRVVSLLTWSVQTIQRNHSISSEYSSNCSRRCGFVVPWRNDPEWRRWYDGSRNCCVYKRKKTNSILNQFSESMKQSLRITNKMGVAHLLFIQG